MSDSSLGKMIVTFFNAHLKTERGLSPNTIASYSTCCALFFEFVSKTTGAPFDKIDVHHISQKLVLAFLDDLESSRGNSPKTRNLRLAALRTLFRFIALHLPQWAEVCERVCAIRLKNAVSSPPLSLNREEAEAFLSAPDLNSPLGLRDQALFYLLYATGARVSELVNLKRQDFQRNGPPSIRILGKGMKVRDIPLTEPIADIVTSYLKQREAAGITHSRLFLNCKKEPITRFGIRAVIKSYHRRLTTICPSLAGKSISPHSFRHTCALHLLTVGVGLGTIKDYLGHADLSTTHQYTKINVAMKIEALEKLLPPESDSISKGPDWKKPEMMEFLKNLQRVA